MNIKPRIATVTAALLAAPVVALATAPAAHADVDRHGTWAGSVYEFSVDREGNGFEVSVDVDRASSGSRWKITLWHDGQRVLRTTRTADYEGDVEVETWRRNTVGSDTFKVKIKNVGTRGAAKSTITLR